MAITYVNDLRLSEMDTGDNSGTWGTVTNTNLELIGEALGFGTEAITTNADTHASVIADGSTDPVRAMYVKYTGTLDSACTITISPNTVNKFYYIENATSGSQNIIISQGSGANVTIPAGDTKAVYLDGAGSGAAVTDAFASLNVVDLKVQDDLTVTDDASVGGDLLVSGEVQTANIGFTDGDNAMVIADGGAVTFPIASVFTGGFASNAASTITIDDNGTALTLVSTDADSTLGPQLNLYRNSASPADNDFIGQIYYTGRNDNSQDFTGASFLVRSTDVSDGSEDAELRISVMSAGSVNNMLRFLPAETVFNEENKDIDFRIEGDTLPNLFHVDAGEDSLGINTVGVSGSLVTLQGKAGSDGSSITTKTLHLIEGGYNDGNTFQVSDASSVSRFGVDGSGRVIIGNAVSRTAQGFATTLQVEGTSATTSSLQLVRNSNSVDPPYINFGKSRATATGGVTAVANNDLLGEISWTAADGTDLNNVAATIRAKAAAAATGNSTPGRLEFLTTTSGSGDATERLRIDNNGNIIIANTGGTLSTNTSGASNFRAGVNAGNSIASGGNYNVAVGDEAGTAITTGDQNTFVGYRAGTAVETSVNNTAVGMDAMLTNSTGGNNVAVGRESLKRLTTSSENVAVGSESLKETTTGNSCTAIGHMSGQYNETGDGNTFLGHKAGQGSSSTYLTGNENTAVGRNAGLVLQGAAVGNQCFGTFAGDQITTGDYNVCLGYDVGSSVQNLTTGNRNILIGYKTSGPGTTDNAIGIGDQVTVVANDFSFGKASNVVTNDFDADANWSRSSDERLKKNITNQTLGLDFINDLRTVKYNWKPSDELDANDAQLAHLRRQDDNGNIINDMNTDVVMHNFIAQEVKAALDTAGVSEFGGWKEDQFGVQQVSREMFVIPLVKAVQELSTKLDAALDRIATLEG